MQTLFSQLKSIPVITESDTLVGKVKDLEINIDTLAITKYIVNQGFFTEDLMISPEQVISITSEKIIVDDNLNQEKILTESPAITTSSATSPAIEKSQD